MTNELLGPKALGAHIIVGLLVCGLLLVLLWLQTESVAVIINAFAGLIMALTVGRWLEQRDELQENRQANVEAEEVRDG